MWVKKMVLKCEKSTKPWLQIERGCVNFIVSRLKEEIQFQNEDRREL